MFSSQMKHNISNMILACIVHLTVALIAVSLNWTRNKHMDWFSENHVHKIKFMREKKNL